MGYCVIRIQARVCCVCVCVRAGLESSRSRLRNMVTLRLSGLDITESTLRLLQRHMPQLERLDLAHCKDLTDSSVALLAAAGTHTRNNLTELTLAGLNKHTDHCWLFHTPEYRKAAVPLADPHPFDSCRKQLLLATNDDTWSFIAALLS